MTLDSIFEALGGSAGLGRAIGVTTEHASAMRRRNSIPARYWIHILPVLKAKGIAFSALDLARLQSGAAISAGAIATPADGDVA